MVKVLHIYTDACISNDNDIKRGFASFIAITDTTHIMSRAYMVETDNIFIAEKEAAILAVKEIEDDGYDYVEIHIDNKAAVYAITDMVKNKVEPFNKFNEIRVMKVEAHQELNNPNKVADMLSAAGRSLYNYDNGLQSRVMYRLQYPSRVAEGPTIASNGEIPED